MANSQLTNNEEDEEEQDISTAAVRAAHILVEKLKQQDEAIQELNEQVMVLREKIRYLEKRHG